MAYTQWLLQLNIDSASVFGAAFIYNITIYVIYSLFFMEKTGSKTLCLDLGRRLGQNRVIGDSRGFICIPVALIIGCAGWLLSGEIFHVVIAVGAAVGTTMNSFIKRRLGIERGSSFPFMDQTDFVFGGYLFAAPITSIPPMVLFTGIAQALIVHSTVNTLCRSAWRSWMKK